MKVGTLMINLSTKDVMNMLEIKQKNVIRHEMLEGIDLEMFISAVALMTPENEFPDMDGATLNKILYASDQIWNIVFPVAGKISDPIIKEELYQIYTNDETDEKTRDRIVHLDKISIYEKAMLDKENFIESERLKHLEALIYQEGYRPFLVFDEPHTSYWMEVYITAEKGKMSKAFMKFIEDNKRVGYYDLEHSYNKIMKRQKFNAELDESSKEDQVDFSDIFETANIDINASEEKEESANIYSLADSSHGFIGIDRTSAKKKFSFRKNKR